MAITFATPRHVQFSSNAPWLFLSKHRARKGAQYEMLRLDFIRFDPKDFRFTIDKHGTIRFNGDGPLCGLKPGDAVIGIDGVTINESTFDQFLSMYVNDVVDIVIERIDIGQFTFKGVQADQYYGTTNSR